MTINKHSFFPRLFKWTYGRLPYSVAALALGSMFSIIILPLIVHSSAINVIAKTNPSAINKAYIGISVFLVEVSLGFLLFYANFIELQSVFLVPLTVRVVMSALFLLTMFGISRHYAKPNSVVSGLIIKLLGLVDRKITWQ